MARYSNKSNAVAWLLLGALASACGLRSIDVPERGGAGGNAMQGDASLDVGGGGFPSQDASADAPADSLGDCSSCIGGNCACVPPAPQDWEHAVVAEHTDGTRQLCPQGFDAPIILGLGAKDTGCGSCVCKDPAARCRSETYDQCGGTYKSGGDIIGAGCNTSLVTNATQATKLDTYKTCTDFEPQPLEPVFDTTVTVCRHDDTALTSCGNGVCLPTPLPPFEAMACVISSNSGDQTCPAGYPVKRSYATGFNDQRSCPSCQCPTSALSCKGATVRFCEGKNCTGCRPARPFGACVQGPVASVDVVMPLCSNGPSGAAGSVSTAGLRVVCCTAS